MNKLPSHYIDNEKFFEVLKKHGVDVRRAIRQKVEVPRVPEYIGACFIKIANNLALKPNFNNYTFIDEMISDAVENCFIYTNNFDIKKSKNPFAYFTQITYYAFIRRIQKEKRQLNTKYRYIESLGADDIIRQAKDDGDYETPYIDFLKQQVSLAAHELEHDEKLPKAAVRRPKYMDKKPQGTKLKV